MIFCIIKIAIIYFLLCISVHKNPKQTASFKNCSREQSSIVRQILHKLWKPIFVKYDVKMPIQCPLHFSRDVFKLQELAKLHYRVNLWTCAFCGKSFFAENFIDAHFSRHHANTIRTDEEAICIADYCDIFRCRGFKSEDSTSSINDTQKSSSSKALVVGPPHELAALLDAGEREKNSDAFIGLSGVLDPWRKSRKRTTIMSANNIEVINNERRDSYNILSRLTKYFWNSKSTNEGIANEKQHCDSQEMEQTHEKCQNLIFDCISPLLTQLTNEEYQSIKEYLDRHFCWYLTCDRYWRFSGSRLGFSGPSLGILIILGIALIFFLIGTYYIVWFCF